MHALMVPNYNKILLAYVQFRQCNWQILCHCHAGLWGDQTRFERQRTTFRLFCVQIHANEFSTISFLKTKQRKSPTEIQQYVGGWLNLHPRPLENTRRRQKPYRVYVTLSERKLRWFGKEPNPDKGHAYITCFIVFLGCSHNFNNSYRLPIN